MTSWPQGRKATVTIDGVEYEGIVTSADAEWDASGVTTTAGLRIELVGVDAQAMWDSLVNGRALAPVEFVEVNSSPTSNPAE